MQHTLKNDKLTAVIDEHGAELVSVIKDKKEYIWQADPAFWGRHAPVLFPIVGSMKNKTFVHEGKAYIMNQHGFARDTDFKLIQKTDDTLWFEMSSTEESFKKYPFHFTLSIGYTLTDNHLKVMWKVENTGHDMMYFSIGAHPGFTCPLNDGEKQSDYFIDFHTNKDITMSKIGEGGLVASYEHPVKLNGGLLSVDPHLFDDDALIIENCQTQSVSLLTPDKKPYVTVDFNAPLFGVWSPVGKQAPFVCIEPWYGRCDSIDFNGELKDRVYGQRLKPSENFSADYTITFE